MENSGKLKEWTGCYYGLAIELGERSDLRFDTALKALWDFPGLDGCYSVFECGTEPDKEERQGPSLELSSLNRGKLYGVATLPDGIRVPCRTVEVRELDSKIDWLVLCIPLEILDDIYDPTGEFYSKPRWREPIAEWLAEIGKQVYRVVPFRLGLVGMEVSGETYASTVAASGIPDRRQNGYLWPTDEGLVWHPVNWWRDTSEEE